MTPFLSPDKAAAYLHRLCVEFPSRRVGSAGNRAASDWFASVAAALGFATECLEFDCIDWTEQGAELVVGGTLFAVQASPYTNGGRARGPLAVVSTLDALEALPQGPAIVLVRGELAKEQLMPKNFRFYNPEEHQRIVALLESKAPRAIVAATARNPELAGAVYPFPLIEDGDFDIPSVYMTEEEGSLLAGLAGQEAALDIRAQRIPARGCNVVALKGTDAQRRVVVMAHIDAKAGTPGATDNASGVVVVLLLAELLAGYSGRLGIELVAMNGEDYYLAPGEVQYLERNEGRFADIVLGINLDGVGYHQGHTAYSLYDCPADLADTIRQAFSTHDELMEGELWYQSDHGLFLMNQRPALAITSERFTEILAEFAHTPKDRPEIVDPAKLVATALALRDLLLALDRQR